jgi:RHS repeat-associated protein
VRYQFTGRERDADWLYYYRARYYSPRLARFLQPDPIGRAGGVNPYAYAGNNPLLFVDPSGLRTYTVHGCCQNPGSRGDWWDFSRQLGDADPDVHVFTWSSSIFFDVFPSTKTASEALVDQILRDLADRPLAPGEKLNIIGHSAGGIIANNAANTLRARGIPVDNLIMMGTPLFPGTINASMPSDVPITNFHDGFDPLSTTKQGPNVTNIPVTSQNAAGTFDALTAHTGYATNDIVINTIKGLIAK